MEKAVTRLNNSAGTSPAGAELGGEFPIADLETEETGVLQICMDGIGLTFNDKKVSPPLSQLTRLLHSSDRYKPCVYRSLLS